MDVAGQPGQFAALLLRQHSGVAHADQHARQQDRHHPQVAHDRQQQAAQALAAGAAPWFGMQRPDLFGGALAVQQCGYGGKIVFQRRTQTRRQ